VSLNFNFPQGNEALMELGIKTGLTLLFSLLKQNWFLANQTGQQSFSNAVCYTLHDKFFVVQSAFPVKVDEILKNCRLPWQDYVGIQDMH
jgi:hypothetical protein